MNFSDMLLGLYERLSKTRSLTEITNPLIRNALSVKVV